jgi:hypothetical protein
MRIKCRTKLCRDAYTDGVVVPEETYLWKEWQRRKYRQSNFPLYRRHLNPRLIESRRSLAGYVVEKDHNDAYSKEETPWMVNRFT